MPNGGNASREQTPPWVVRNWTLIIRLTGWCGVIFSTVVWLLTNRLSPELLGVFGTLMGVGEGLDAIKQLQTARTRSEEPEPESEA